MREVLSAHLTTSVLPMAAPKGKREAQEEEWGDQHAYMVVDREVRRDCAGVDESCACIRRLLEPWEAGHKQRHPAQRFGKADHVAAVVTLMGVRFVTYMTHSDRRM